MSKASFIYFIRPAGANGPTKIGYSGVPEDRLETLAAWSPVLLEVVAKVPGSFDLERNIHQCFADLHSHKEWFRSDARIDAVVAALNSGKSITEAMDLTDRRGSIKSFKQMDPDARQRQRYSMRLSWAQRRARTGSHYFTLPEDVATIIARWRGYGAGYYATTKVSPSAAEIARLDEVLSDPAKHLVAHSLGRAAA
jgi:hypothetical protein